jgi:hypothetical protein
MTDANLTAALPAPVAEYVRASNAFDADGHLTLLIITRNSPTPAWA